MQRSAREQGGPDLTLTRMAVDLARISLILNFRVLKKTTRFHLEKIELGLRGHVIHTNAPKQRNPAGGRTLGRHSGQDQAVRSK